MYLKRILPSLLLLPLLSFTQLSCNGGTAVVDTALNADEEPVQVLTAVSLDADKVALGRDLFTDGQLSSNNQVSCASCHGLNEGGDDGRVVSRGVNGRQGDLNAPTVFNSSLNIAQFWDGRSEDLAEQSLEPIQNPVEMDSTLDEVIAKLAADADYVTAFNNVYSPGSTSADAITADNIADALAAFQTSLITTNSPFDQFLNGDTTAITQDAYDGYELFKSVGCTDCHAGASVGGESFEKMGLFGDYFGDRGGDIEDSDLGRFNVTGLEEDRFVFKVPSLRVATITAPYFHDGSVDTIEEAVHDMGTYQLNIDLSDAEVDLIVAFLDSLVGELNGQIVTDDNGGGGGRRGR
jgi:cytochrome c peroxidase